MSGLGDGLVDLVHMDMRQRCIGLMDLGMIATT